MAQCARMRMVMVKVVSNVVKATNRDEGVYWRDNVGRKVEATTASEGGFTCVCPSTRRRRFASAKIKGGGGGGALARPRAGRRRCILLPPPPLLRPINSIPPLCSACPSTQSPHAIVRDSAGVTRARSGKQLHHHRRQCRRDRRGPGLDRRR